MKTRLLWTFAAILVLGLPSAQVADSSLFGETNLLDAIRCLRTSRYDLLGKSFGRNVYVRFMVGTFDKSRKGTYVYIAVYPSRTADSARVFNFLVRKGPCPSLALLNDAGIRERKGKVSFATPPLGGEWTRTDLLRAISRMRGASMYEVVSDTQPTCGECRTYYGK